MTASGFKKLLADTGMTPKAANCLALALMLEEKAQNVKQRNDALEYGGLIKCPKCSVKHAPHQIISNNELKFISVLTAHSVNVKCPACKYPFTVRASITWAVRDALTLPDEETFRRVVLPGLEKYERLRS